MKRYVFQVVIEEGNDEFWEDIAERGESGCQEVSNELRALLTDGGDPFQPTIKLISFEDS